MTSREWLKKLIGFDTTSRNSNLNLIHCIQDYLKTLHIESYLTYNDTHLKANLFATLATETNTPEGGLILSGHTDVVPVDNQAWDSDPFHAQETTDRIIGRGAADMKGFIAVVLSLIPHFQKLSLKYPIHLAFSYDEEVGCLGAHKLIQGFQEKGFKPRACIVGEPTLMKPVVAHKGIQGFRCKIQGKAAHSSLVTQGCNAVEYAAEFIQWLRALSLSLRKDKQDSAYDVPFTTLTTNMIQGGTAVNIIPSLCEFVFEFRNLPHLNPKTLLQQIEAYIQQTLLPTMQKNHPDSHITLEPLNTVPGFEAHETAHIVKLARDLTNDASSHKVSYATEAGLFQAAHIPTIVCGPGSIEQAHRANEYVMLEQLNQCEQFLLKLVQIF